MGQIHLKLKWSNTSIKARTYNSDESTRLIFASEIETITDSSISSLFQFDSIKRTIRRNTPGLEHFNISSSAANITIPEKFRAILKGE